MEFKEWIKTYESKSVTKHFCLWDLEESFKAGYEAAMKELQDEGAFETLPCDCHLFEKQICSHCTGDLMGFRRK